MHFIQCLCSGFLSLARDHWSLSPCCTQIPGVPPGPLLISWRRILEGTRWSLFGLGSVGRLSPLGWGGVAPLLSVVSGPACALRALPYTSSSYPTPQLAGLIRFLQWSQQAFLSTSVRISIRASHLLLTAGLS